MQSVTIEQARTPLGKVPPLPKGCDQWTEERGYSIAQVHFSADPDKTPAWAAKRLKESPSERTFRQEFEIDHYAGAGALMYPEFSRGLNVVKPFPIPHDWTRYFGLDPHKRRPHAMLWMAVSPDGDHWYYREYWPSRIYGKKGNTPEDDKLYHVDDYVKAVKYMEGPEVDFFGVGGFADNQKKPEKIRLRVQDTHGKAIFTTTIQGKDEPETFWDRYRTLGIHCTEAKKDINAGRDKVGMRLRARTATYADETVQEPCIHVFETLPELIFELRSGRFPSLTPAQAERQDPGEKELQKRKHMIDLIRYIEMENPSWLEPSRSNRNVKALEESIAY